MITINIDNFFLYILVFVRIAGVLAFNPIINQKGFPAIARAGLALTVTIIVAPNVAAPEIDYGGLMYLTALFKELFIGFVLSHICTMFYYLLMAAGEIMDMQIGFSMAEVMDPTTNLQMGLSDKLLNFLFVCLFFVTNCHLLIFRLLFSSYDVLPIGVGYVDFANIAGFGIEVFIDTFAIALKLCVPFVICEFILEIGLGILMKLIPAIHVFVINLQMKIALGIFLLLILAVPMAEFIDEYLVSMFEAMKKSIEHFG